MTWILSLLVVSLLQQPPPVEQVVVGMLDGSQVTIANPEFTGFIQGHFPDAVLIYRLQSVHGQMPLKTISKLEFGPYEKGRPFAITVTLKNGEKLQVESERHDYITLAGKTNLGLVRIKQPGPFPRNARSAPETGSHERPHDSVIWNSPRHKG